MATVFRKLALASAMGTALILPASAETIFALTFPVPEFYWKTPPAFYDNNPIGYIEAGMHLCAKSSVIKVKDLTYRQIIIAGGQVILIDTSEGLPGGVRDPANDKKCQENAGLYAQSNPQYAQVFSATAQSAWRNRVSSPPVAGIPRYAQMQNKPQVAPNYGSSGAGATTFIDEAMRADLKEMVNSSGNQIYPSGILGNPNLSALERKRLVIIFFGEIMIMATTKEFTGHRTKICKTL